MTETQRTEDEFRQRLDQAKQGDTEALNELLKDARRFLHHVARSTIDADMRSKLSTSDLVQDALVDVNRHFSSFRGTDNQQLMAWLRRILINNLLNRYRSYRQTQRRAVSRETHQVDVESLPVVGESPSRMAVHNEDRVRLETALNELPLHYQKILRLRHQRQLSFVRIAELLGKNPDAVRKQWYRAFEQLSQALEPQTVE